MRPIIILVLVLFMVCFSLKAFAHCDTMDGPVVKDAQIALEKGDVTPVLKWIKKDAEPEVREAFQTAVTERKKGAEAKESADKKFFETLIRIHRTGEGADFTGLKPAGSVEPIIAEADKAIESGSVEALTAKMAHHLTGDVKERFDRVLEKNKHKDESVEAGREYVEAYIEYTHYVEGIHKAIMGGSEHHHVEAGESGKEEGKILDKNKEVRGAKNMKVLKIKWQRLISDKQTCPRCGSTEKELEKAVSTLQQCLIPLGIRVSLEKKELSTAEFKKDPLRSNQIWLNDRLLEDWIGGKVGQSQCCDVCGPSDCRTVGIGGEVYEAIPTDLVVKAGLLAASQLISSDNNSKSCGKNETPAKKSGGCCPK